MHNEFLLVFYGRRRRRLGSVSLALAALNFPLIDEPDATHHFYIHERYKSESLLSSTLARRLRQNPVSFGLH